MRELDPQIVATDKKSGTIQDCSVLEEHGVAFDPSRMALDLTKAEKRRTTALLLAIQAYDHLIIKDAEMYSAISREASRKDGPVIQPATMDAMVEAAINFDAFIAGEFSRPSAPGTNDDEKEAEPGTPEATK